MLVSDHITSFSQQIPHLHTEKLCALAKVGTFYVNVFFVHFVALPTSAAVVGSIFSFFFHIFLQKMYFHISLVLKWIEEEGLWRWQNLEKIFCSLDMVYGFLQKIASVPEEGSELGQQTFILHR